MPDMAAPSRDAELVTRGKLFQLKFAYFLSPGPADLVIPRFIVPKVLLEDGTVVDVRCVWDCRINGHNETLWAPGFMLPTAQDAEDQVVKWLSTSVASYLQQGSPIEDYTQDTDHFIKSKQGDIDIGKHFNNFRVHEEDQISLGVRYVYTDNSPGAVEREEIMKFNCCPFGNKCCPFAACQGQARVMELCKGSHDDPRNEFQFASCHLNLVMSKHHDPSMPRVMLLRADGELASTEVTFVDDIRVAGRCKEGEFDHAKKSCKQLKSRLNSHGNQADDRKFTFPLLCSGAWNGFILHTDTPFPMKSTTGKKWDKFKKGLRLILDIHEQGLSFIKTGELRAIAGLGVNITEVYPPGRSFLKGFFNARSLEGWQGP